jgi:hypothetical protein
MIFHELMAGVIDRLVINGEKIPIIFGSQISSQILRRATFGDDSD